VTGATGFLGSNLISRLLKSGTEIIAIDLKGERSKTLEENGVTFVEADLLKAQDLHIDFRDLDWIFHFAGLASPKESTANPGIASNDILASKMIFRKAIGEGIRKIVFPSSGGTVYGQPQHLPIDENHPTNPLIPYAAAKVEIERMLLDMCRGTATMPVILRYSNPYGPNQYFNRGTGVITHWLETVREKGQVTMYGSGEEARDYIFVSDAIEAAVSVVEKDAPHQLYNIGSGIPTSLNELLMAIETVTRTKLDIRRYPPRNLDVVRAIALDSSKASTDFDWRPKVPLENGLRTTWEWVQNGEPFQI